jgi:deoxyribose-phosphate aldolase
MVKAGATRIGTSSGVKLISGEQVNKGYWSWKH